MAVAELVPECGCVCDVGTDHGYLPIYLVNEGVCGTAYALDVRTGPLSRAAEHVREEGLSERISLFLSDGLEVFSDAAITRPDAIVMAGMGGLLMEDILTRGAAVAQGVEALVLSPQSHVADFRRFLLDGGYDIAGERIVCEDGKYYFIIKAIPGKGPDPMLYDAAALRYGASLVDGRDPVLLNFLAQERQRLLHIKERLSKEAPEAAEDAAGQGRLHEICEEISIIERIMDS